MNPLNSLRMFLTVTLAARPAALLACPYCNSDIGRQVSAGIFNGDFWLNATLTLLPVPVLFLIVAMIHFGAVWPMRLSKPQAAPPRDSIPSDRAARSHRNGG